MYALENVVDFFTDAIVLWRFFAPKSVDADVEKKLNAREDRASLGISYILLILGIFVLITASLHVHKGKMDGIVDDIEKYASVIALSFISIIVFITITILKFRYAKVLQSDSLYKDGICSLIGTLLSMAMFLNAILVQNKPWLWWIDPTVALLCGIFAIMYGIGSLHHAKTVQKIPICSFSWFMNHDHQSNSTATPTSNGIPDDKINDLEMT